MKGFIKGYRADNGVEYRCQINLNADARCQREGQFRWVTAIFGVGKFPGNVHRSFCTLSPSPGAMSGIATALPVNSSICRLVPRLNTLNPVQGLAQETKMLSCVALAAFVACHRHHWLLEGAIYRV